MRSSKTPLSFDDDTDEILSHSLSLCCLSQKVFLIKRFFQTRGRRQQKENLSLSRGTLFRSLLFSKRAKKCFSTRENFRAFNDDDLLFFLGQKQPVWVEKDSRNSRAFAFKSQKRSVCENEWCDLFLSLSLSLERARERGGTLVKTLASKRRKALLWSSVRRASSEAFAVERGCKNNASSKGQNEMREFLKTNKQHREQKKERKQTQEQKRVLLRGKKCEYK